MKTFNSKLKNLALAAFTSAGLLISGSALAASDGSLGITSEGTSDLSLGIDDQVQITNVADIAFGNISDRASDVTDNDTVCVHSNKSDNLYQVKASVDGKSSFVMSDGVEDLDFRVFWAGNNIGTNQAELLHDTYIDQDANAADLVGDPAANCGGVDNARIEYLVESANLQSALEGSYTATVRLTVEPF